MTQNYKHHNQSKKSNTNRQLTARRKRFIYGLLLGVFIVSSPYLFYLYRTPPPETQSWQIAFITLNANEFYDVSYFLHALFTKFSLVFFSSLAFLHIKAWWKWAILVPIVMFLYQLFSVVNSNLMIFDEYSLWKSLTLTIPVLSMLIYSAIKLNNRVDKLDVYDSAMEEYESALNEDPE